MTSPTAETWEERFNEKFTGKDGNWRGFWEEVEVYASDVKTFIASEIERILTKRLEIRAENVSVMVDNAVAQAKQEERRSTLEEVKKKVKKLVPINWDGKEVLKEIDRMLLAEAPKENENP